MPNPYVLQRLLGIQTILKGVHQAGVPMSAAAKGQERAAFIDQFLSQVLPLPYRFGTGDAADLAGNKSGQLDVVVEYPFAPTLPLGGGPTRLYLAEGVAAVVEVKSDVASQWNEALDTAALLAPLTRKMGTVMVIRTRTTSANSSVRCGVYWLETSSNRAAAPTECAGNRGCIGD
jgi:hypothetical protein